MEETYNIDPPGNTNNYQASQYNNHLLSKMTMISSTYVPRKPEIEDKIVSLELSSCTCCCWMYFIVALDTYAVIFRTLTKLS